MSKGTKRTQTTERQYVPPAYRRASRRGGSGGKRELVVASLSRGHGRRCRREQFVPYVRMSGAWLRRLGFERGDRIEVIAERGRLVLTIVREERELQVN